MIRGLSIVASLSTASSFFLIAGRDFTNPHQSDGITCYRPPVTRPRRCHDRFPRHDLRLRLCASALAKIEKTIVADNLVPSELGPRNNMVLMVCLIPLIATALLFYLVIKTSATVPSP